MNNDGFSILVTAVNEYAMLGLDKVEQKLPILQKPADQVRVQYLFWEVNRHTFISFLCAASKVAS